MTLVSLTTDMIYMSKSQTVTFFLYFGARLFLTFFEVKFKISSKSIIVIIEILDGYFIYKNNFTRKMILRNSFLVILF